MLAALASGQVSYDQMCNLIIRPPRAKYTLAELGPKIYQINGREFQRTDFEIVNKRGLKLYCSHYEPTKEYRPKEKLPCVIYCHGNCGCRLDAGHQLDLLLPYNITVLVFDFSGSGLSEGEYVTLGYYEKDDLTAAVDYLRNCGTVSKIALWGRSMGAATSLMFGVSDPSIAGMVIDSPFLSLSILAKELVETYASKLPKMMVSLGFKMIRKTVKTKAKFDIEKLNPIDDVGSCFIPALFAHADGDDFILPHHSKTLHEKYGGDKNIILFDGDHNTVRPPFFYDSAVIFLVNVLLSGEDKDLLELGNFGKVKKGENKTTISNLQYATELTPEEVELQMVEQAIAMSLNDEKEKLEKQNSEST